MEKKLLLTTLKSYAEHFANQPGYALKDARWHATTAEYKQGILTPEAIKHIKSIRDEVRMGEAGTTDVAESGGRCGIVSEEVGMHGYGCEFYGAYQTPKGLIEHAWVDHPAGHILDATRDQFGEAPGVRLIHPNDPEYAKYHRGGFEEKDLIG